VCAIVEGRRSSIRQIGERQLLLLLVLMLLFSLLLLYTEKNPAAI